jgi:hypothetical protein
VSKVPQEAIAVGIAGALLGGITGRIVGFPVLGTAIGALSGAVSGARHMYDWKSTRGIGAFVLDHTWALATTTASVVATGVNAATGAHIDESLTTRQNRMTFEKGLVMRRGFAVTFGYVVNGAADRDGNLSERRRKLVTHHEDQHVWQARMFGPIYPVVYAGWFAVGSIVATVKWLVAGRKTKLIDEVDATAYYRNPFEWHAYSSDDNWPPHGVDATKVWAQPFIGSSRTPSTPR